MALKVRTRRFFCDEASCERVIFCERLPEVAANVAPVGIGKVRVLGIDDLAFTRGSAYGTILVDLERRKVAHLLPERSTASTADWLRRHPGVEVVRRDRSDVYAQDFSEGTPAATQVADRWHLLHSLALGLEAFLLHKCATLRKATTTEASDKEPRPRCRR